MIPGVLYVFVFALFLAEFILSRREPLVSAEDPGLLMRPFRRCAVRLYRKLLVFRRKHPGGPSFLTLLLKKETVRRDLQTLEPAGYNARKEAEYYIGKWQTALCLVFAADFLAISVFFSQKNDVLLRDGLYVDRENYNGSPVDLTVREENFGDFSVSVGEKEYTEEEAGKLSEEVFARLPHLILGDNPSIRKVSRPLQLMSKVEGYPFRIRWESSSYGMLDSDGSVMTDGLKEEETREVVLTAILTYGELRFEKNYSVGLTGPQRTEEEMTRRRIEEAILEKESSTRNKEVFELPSGIEGQSLVWSAPVRDKSLPLFLLFAAAGVLSGFLQDQQLHARIDARSRELSIDYPQIISKMVLFIGAGMSIRNVFYKLGSDYAQVTKEGGKQRYAYEEILFVCHELDSGVSEWDAYTHFGERCRSRQYIKLCSLLTQNLRKGSSSLLPALQEEAERAFDERKNLARQLGEEAGTKLLLPMIMMLSVTLLIIIVPAYYGFSM